ncbi:MAG: hypothetical protein KKB70_05630 [Proteobacteria bacterium]|nr:hypothetical protein [Pseudomonadota bacterium]MBU1611745.1 hypothetical protein [Pseudomonadota bacterium]
MSQTLGIKFTDHGQIYRFSSGPFVVETGSCVIVKTEQGMGLGEVVTIHHDEDATDEEFNTIYRLANEQDLVVRQENLDLARNAFRYCRGCVTSHKLEMKLVDVEVFFDRSKMIFYFTAPGRIDFRELIKDLVREYRTRIELRQIGVRHETQMLGAIGNCGQMCCCRRFMRKFVPVTIKMAKEQNLFLNPTKISGICGRLLCCLSFEQQGYEEFNRKCPKVGKRYQSSQGQVKVIRTNFFRKTLTVVLEDGSDQEISVDDWVDFVNKAPSPSESGEKAELRPGSPRAAGLRPGSARPSTAQPSSGRPSSENQSEEPQERVEERSQEAGLESTPQAVTQTQQEPDQDNDQTSDTRRPRRRRRRPRKKN